MHTSLHKLFLKKLPKLSVVHSCITLSFLATTTLLSNTTQAQVNVFQATFTSQKQTNEVAFIPFAGDKLISSIVKNDLNLTKLKVTSENLPQTIHRSSSLNGTLNSWQQLGIPYLVVGNTYSSGGKVVIEYEVVDVNTGRVLQGKQTQTTDSDSQSMTHTAHAVASKIYEIITGTPGDLHGRIAYIEESGSGNNKVSSLKVMSADGKEKITLFSDKGSFFSPAWSPDGQLIAFATQKPNGLAVIRVINSLKPMNNNQEPFIVTQLKGNNLSPSFSADGGSILFSSSYKGNADIYRMAIGSKTPQPLVQLPSNEVSPSYAPDGRSFLFVSDKTGTPKIYRYNFGGGISQVSRGGRAESPSFSPDGSKIAFLNGSSASIMNADGSNVVNIANTGTDGAPSFSSNGTRVVYGGKGKLNFHSLNGGASFSVPQRGTIHSPVWSK